MSEPDESGPRSEPHAPSLDKSADRSPSPGPAPATEPAARVEPAAPAVRASDAEREQVAEVVRRAVGDGRLTLLEGDERLSGIYASLYRGDLERFTEDLGDVVPAASASPGAAPVPRAHGAPVERPSTSSSVAVMSGSVRKGAWTPGRTHVAVAVMGGVELRLRDAQLGRQELTITAVALMGGVTVDLRGADIGPQGVTVHAVAFWGGVEVIVDPDTRVDERGVGLMGGFGDESGAPARTDGPVVRVDGVAIMGGVSAQRRGLGLESDDGHGELPPGP